jgi:F-type H+-transporting ATPase subunit a
MTVFHALEHATGVPWVLWSALVAAALLLATGLAVRARLAAAGGGVVPDEGVTLRNLVEIVVEALAGIAEQTMGHKWRTYFPFVATLFFFILISNLIQQIPGFAGATSDANTTYAWAVISFVVHQYVGVREHGWGYVRHFLGPVWWLSWLILPIELITQLSRVFTLAVRLLANMFADHLVVGIALSLVPVAIPAVFMGLGLFVAFLQAYVFTLLSMIYIGLALGDSH